MREDDLRESRRRFLLASGALGLGAIGLAACSSSNGGDVAAGEGGSAEPTTTGGGEKSADDRCPPAGDEPKGAPVEVPTPDQSGYIWSGARMLFVTTGIDPDGVGEWLPPGLKLSDPAKATWFVAHYPTTNFGSVYNEAAVLLHVEDDKGPAWHCMWMVVDDDTALIYGRELLGFPKKMAEITFDEREDGIVGRVVRRGEEVLKLTAQTGDFRDEEGGVFVQRIVNVHGAVVGGMRFIEIPPLDEQVHERKVGTAAVTARSTQRDPLGDLAPESAGEAMFTVLDFGKLQGGGKLGDPLPLDWATRMTFRRAS